MTKLRLLLGACGVVFLIWVINLVGPSAIFHSLNKVGWSGFLVILLFYAAAQIPSCIGWRALLGASANDVTLPGLYKAYVVGDALNHTVPSADVAGEVTKVLMLSGSVPWRRTVGSLVIHRALEVASSAFLLGLGLLVAWTRFELPVWWYALGACIFLGLLGFASGLVRLQRSRLYMRVVDRVAARIGEPKTLSEDSRLVELEDAARTRLFWAASAVFASWAAGILEAYLCLFFLDLPARWDLAIAVEGLGLVVSNLAFFIPGRIGASEGGRLLLFSALHISTPDAMALAVLRRLREIVWIAAGFLVLAFYRRRSAASARLQRQGAFTVETID